MRGLCQKAIDLKNIGIYKCIDSEKLSNIFKIIEYSKRLFNGRLLIAFHFEMSNEFISGR